MIDMNKYKSFVTYIKFYRKINHLKVHQDCITEEVWDMAGSEGGLIYCRGYQQPGHLLHRSHLEPDQV